MRLKVVTGPETEIVTLAEAKAHLRVSDDSEDDYIASLIVAAREVCEMQARRALIDQTLELGLEEWPWCGVITLPRPPLQSVISIKYTDRDGVEHTMSSTDYVVDTMSQPGRVLLGPGKSWPSAALQPGTPIIVRFVAGYGDEAVEVPQRYHQAVKLLIGHWFEHREPVIVGQAVQALPLAVQTLLADRGGFF